MKRGDVYYVDLNPNIGHEQWGVRPCVIIQNDKGNRNSGTLIVAAITSKRKKMLPTHVPICGKDRLHYKSVILLECIRTIDKRRLQNFVCTLSDETMRKVDEALKISLDLKEEGGDAMKEIIEVNNQILTVKEYEGVRVVTLKDIDAVHKRPEGTARKRFNDNKKHFIEGEDYFKITPSEYRTVIGEMDSRQQNDITLVTESGYLMLVKSFTDDLAWDVQRKLVNSYFNKKKTLTAQEMMRMQLGMIDDHEDRISLLENTMNIDYEQQQVLKKEIASAVIDSLGGKDSIAYNEMSKKVFAECNRDVKDYFNVNSRCNIPRLKFDKAVEYIRRWIPCIDTRAAIKLYNSQIDLGA